MYRKTRLPMRLNNAFRHYKQFYFSTLPQNLPVVQNPGLDELARCTFNHPIEDEAAGELAQLLGQETPITYRPILPPEARNTLVQSYRSHHVYLRAVKKFFNLYFWPIYLYEWLMVPPFIKIGFATFAEKLKILLRPGQ